MSLYLRGKFNYNPVIDPIRIRQLNDETKTLRGKCHSDFFNTSGRFIAISIAFGLSGVWATMINNFLNKYCDFDTCSPIKMFLILIAITIFFAVVVTVLNLESVKKSF